MKSGVRMRLYLLVVGVLLVALLLRPDAEVRGGHDVVVAAVERRGNEHHLPAIKVRDSAVPTDLFAVDLPAVEELMELPMVEQPVELPVPSIPEITILGWMHSGSTPHVFVEWKGDNHALTPSQVLDEQYQFEGIDQGMAEFTYLPEGTVRLYRVGELGSVD